MGTLPFYNTTSKTHSTFFDDAISSSCTITPCQEPIRRGLFRRPNPKALGWFCLLHLPSMLTTSALLGLYVSEHQWHPNDHEVKVLLVASKIHELLIVVSLSSLLHYRMRHALLRGPRGLPLGLLASPFQLNDPLCLLQRPFLSTAGSMLRAPSEFLTIALVLLGVLLTLVAAPSSGILILPRLDWWRLPASGLEVGDGTTSVHRLFYSAFPPATNARYDLRSADYPRPAEDHFRDLHLSMLAGLDLLVKGSAPNERYRANLSVPLEASTHPFQVDLLDEAGRSGDSRLEVACSAPMSSVTQALTTRGGRWAAHTSKAARIFVKPTLLKDGEDQKGWRQPRVSVQCSPVVEAQGEFKDVTFAGGYFGFVKLEGSVIAEAVKNMSDSRPVTVVGTESELLPLDRNLSAFAIMDSNVGNSQDKRRLACLIDARWVAMPPVWIETERAAISQGGDMVDLDAGRPTEPPISVLQNYAAGWVGAARGFLSNGRASQNSGNVTDQSPLEHMVSHCAEAMHQETLRNRCLSSGLALMLTDTLRRSAALGEEQTGPMDTATYYFTKMDFEYFHFTYSYKFGGWLITFAFVVLFVHVALIAVHLVVLLLGGEWYEGSCTWGGIGELLVLALVATPPEGLRMKTGGDDPRDGWDIWKHRVLVQPSPQTGEGTMSVHEGSELMWIDPKTERRKREWKAFSFSWLTFLNHL
ncbi:hypothetical protein MCOR19_002537 [Pyricularia oryzae]|nr:hypothetical protein MCOR19_002537 [Pyricularia oryzae]KAI6421416.1 hypothetical protein MCOR22_011596 [Pyricularia oryzae]KAI6473524.1 hypothetical protein MCOR18_008253 [Pyricularia oryzae]